MEVDDDTPQIAPHHSSNVNITKSAEVIETIDVTNYKSKKKSRHSWSIYDKNLCKDNKPLMEFINKCIFLDPTRAMETVINKVLLGAYVKADSEYKKSEKFRKVITKAFERLMNDPDRKYTHISDIVETLKIHVSVPKPSPPPVKKRVNFVTLSTKVSVKSHEHSRKRAIIDISTKISPKKSKPEVIALDCDDVDEVIPIDDEGIESNIGEIIKDNIVAKDYPVNDDAIEIQDSQEVKIIDDAQNDDKENEHSTITSNDDGTVINENHENNDLIANEHEKVIPIDDEGIESNISNQVGEIIKDNIVAKDYLFNDDAIEIQDSQEVKIIDDAQNDDKEKEHLAIKLNDDGPVINKKHEKNELITNEHEKENLGSNENLNDENKLLVPHKEKIVRLYKPKLKKKESAKKLEEMTETEKAERIKVIEAKIETCNKTISKLDLEEVTDDSANSPYYKCDRLRATIVKLYKELCTLAEVEEPLERHKIRFHIQDGLPEGPIKRLEKFLNKNADAEGEVPFPDFTDVVRCVQKANEKDGLGWSKAKIMQEAQAIFTYCGRSLQKRRQRREFRDLRGMARPEEFEADPAERDPELQARLEANRRLAQQREAEVFSKFTRLESAPEPTASMSIQIDEPSEHEDSSSDEDTESNPTKAQALNENNNNDKLQNRIEATALKENGNNDKIQNPTEATALKENNNNDKLQNPIEPTALNENINNDKIQNLTEATLLEENDDNKPNDNILGTDGVVIKQEPEEAPIKVQYQGDISLVIEISDSDSEDEYGVLTF